jgi:CheY-like chemotaxis protein
MLYKTILLVDDDEDDHEIFLTAVEHLSDAAQCFTLTDANQALTKLSAKEIEPDVIFLDLNMPIMNGQQFLEKIKKNDQLKHIPVIIFSTSSHPATIELTKGLGAHDFITKPNRLIELVDLLKPLIFRN